MRSDYDTMFYKLKKEKKSIQDELVASEDRF